MFSGQHGYV
jgi:hypothetical protein